MKQVKVIGFPQPKTQIPLSELRIGGPAPSKMINPEIEKEIKQLLKTSKKTKPNERTKSKIIKNR